MRPHKAVTAMIAMALVAGTAAIVASRDRPAGRSGEPVPFDATAWAPTARPEKSAQDRLPDVATMVERLAARLQTTPDDAEGWRMLGWSYVVMGRHDEALRAYQRAIALDGSVGRFHAGYGEALVEAAGGSVTAAARQAFEQALARDSGDVRARFFLALARRQDGDLRGAYDDWSALLREMPAGTPEREEVGRQMATVARELGLADGVPPAGSAPSMAGTITAKPAAPPLPANARTFAVTPDSRIMLVYVSAENCPPCSVWKSRYLDAIRTSSEWQQFEWREVSAFRWQDTGFDGSWPQDLKWLRDALRIESGAPEWAVVVDGTPVWYSMWAEEGGWTRWQRTWDVIEYAVARKLAASAAR